MEVIKRRRTVRRFSKCEQVSRLTIEALLDAARWAPSACNRQRWEFIVIDDEHELRDLETIIGQKALDGNYTYVLVMYDSSKELKGSNLADVQSAAMAVQNLLLVACTLGIGVKLIGGLGDVEVLRRAVDAPHGIRPVILLAIGYAAEWPDPPQRRPLSDMLHYGKFAGKLQPNSRDP
jgi:nitroreductase